MQEPLSKHEGLSGPDEGPVTRCICHDVSFAELLRIARHEHLNFDGLRFRTGCCTGCGTCEPYVRVALATGRTRLPVMSAEEVRRVLRREPGEQEQKTTGPGW